MLRIEKNKLDELIDAQYIMVQRHPVLDLRILNYTRKAQFEKAWNEYTLACRGLVINDDYQIVARPFVKFFNIEEHSAEDIPTLPFEVLEKMDGSLGILFYYANEWHLATRGSFTSDQAIRAKKILAKHEYTNLSEECTYLFEIIYPENRIVVDYGAEEKLVLLAVIVTETGVEYSYDNMLVHMAIHVPTIEIVKRYDGVTDFKKIQELNEFNREGYIVCFANGFRIKLKFEEYCRLHKIVTNVSTREIWELLRDGKPLTEFLERVPDEFDAWVKKTILQLNQDFVNTELNALREYDGIVRRLPEGFTRKDFAMQALRSKNSAMLFHILDGTNYDPFIWNKIEPEWEKPFKQQSEEV